MEVWQPSTWQNKVIKQIPQYRDEATLAAVLGQIKEFPPLVSFDEINQLKNELAQAMRGEAFLLQGGDCAESFANFNERSIQDTYRVLLQMSIILNFANDRKVVRLGRFAGQFAKPRTNDIEIQNNVPLPSYRGDIVNDAAFTKQSRDFDPNRLIRAYFQSAATLNFLRAYTQSTSTHLNSMLKWMLKYTKSNLAKERHRKLALRAEDQLRRSGSKSIQENLNFSPTKMIDFFTSHEALLLNYEQALLRQEHNANTYYSSSAHFLWVGDRTRFVGSAHIEFLRGIANPIGIKCGPQCDPEELKVLLETLNPSNELGKIVLICRMGHKQIAESLPPLVRAVNQVGAHVLWITDPMHGNTQKLKSGIKTRFLKDIREEISQFFEICKSSGVFPGGVHLEMTGKNITECLRNPEDNEHNLNYESLCDPRLNGEQSLDLAFEIAELTKPSLSL